MDYDVKGRRQAHLEELEVASAEDAGALAQLRIWPASVIFPHVQMTRQLLLNYMRHLDQSAQCQR